MVALVKIIVAIVSLIVIPISLIVFFTKVDDEYRDRIKLNTKDIIIISLVAVGYIAITLKLNYISIEHYIVMTLLNGYLVFMSYTDQKTQELYSMVSTLILIVSTPIVFVLVFSGKVTFTEYDILLIPLILLLELLGKMNLLGSGDVSIYKVILLYELAWSQNPFMNLLINLLIADGMFLIVTCTIKFITKNKKKSMPFTLYIAVATFICNLFII